MTDDTIKIISNRIIEKDDMLAGSIATQQEERYTPPGLRTFGLINNGGMASAHAGQLIDVKSMNPRNYFNMLRDGKIMILAKAGSGSIHGERIDIIWRSEILEAAAPYPVNLYDRALWPFLRSLAVKDKLAREANLKKSETDVNKI